MFSNVFQRYSQFWDCEQLAIVDLVGGVRKTVVSLHTISSMAEMITSEIKRINQILPNTWSGEWDVGDADDPGQKARGDMRVD